MNHSKTRGEPRGPVAVSREAKRDPGFDGLRGLCAVALLIVHIGWVAGLTGSYDMKPAYLPAAIVINGFQIFVGVFFLLSGLFLFRPFARAIIEDKKWPELGPYALRRVLRILPPYYPVALVCLLLLNYNSIDGVWYVLRPLVLAQNYDAVWMAGMDITWTVPTELQWYIALPLIALSVSWYARRGPTVASRARRLMIPLPILFLGGFCWFIYLHSGNKGIFPPEYWWPMGVAGNFAAGFLLAVWSARVQIDPTDVPVWFRWAGKHPNLFWFGALVVFAVNCAEPFGGRPGYGDWDTMSGALAFYVLFAVFCFLVVSPMVAPGGKSRLRDAVLANPVSVFLGRISYGVYLWHFVVLNLYFESGSIFGGDPITAPAMRGQAGWELVPAVLAGTIVIATASYYLIERPALNWGERYLARRAAKKQPPQPQVPARRRPEPVQPEPV